jgi:hypothetical protein
LDRMFDAVAMLVLNKLMNPIFFRESFGGIVFVLPHSAKQIRRDAGVERTVGFGGEYVYKVAFVHTNAG